MSHCDSLLYALPIHTLNVKLKKSEDGYHQLANDLRIKNKNEAALFYIDKAITEENCSKKLKTPYRDKSVVLLNMTNFNELLICQNKIISFDSKDPMAYYEKGMTLMVMELYEEALNE